MTLWTVRNELVETLEGAGLRVIGYAPDKELNPPVVVLEEPDNYLSEGDLLKSTVMKVNYDLWLWQKPTTNKSSTQLMDNMIETVVFNLGDWRLAGSDCHNLYQMGSSVLLGSKISVTKYIELGGN